MRRPSLIILSICIAASLEATAHTPQEGDIWATLGPWFHRTNTSESIANHSPYTGGGVVVEGDVDYNGGVEIAMLYNDKLYVRKRGQDEVAERIKRMHITTGYRHWFKPWASAGLAVVSSYSMGDPKVVVDDRPSGEALSTTARDVTEYGMDLSLQWEIIGGENLALVADARYFFSLTHKSHEAADVYGVLLGLKYLVPKNSPKQ